MSEPDLQDRIDEATLDFTLGDTATALEKLQAIARAHPDAFGAWHALAEVRFSDKDHRGALEAAETAHRLRPDDIHINTSLSRIWVELGDKDKAEHFGAEARRLGWKEELKSPPGKEDGPI